MLPEVKLYKHQIETIEFYARNAACINASAPGTGKSITAVAAMEGKGKCLVVCPSFLSRNWVREIEKFTGETAGIYPDKSKRITIYSQDSIYKDSTPFHGLDVLVYDEFHGINTPDSRRSKCFVEYVKEFKPKQLVLMSGTPIRNRVTELYVPLLLLDLYQDLGVRRRFPTPWVFNNYFSCAIQKKFGMKRFTTFEGQRNVDELKKILEGKHIKYTLDELEDLPEIVFDEVFVEDAKPPAGFDEEIQDGWEAMELGAPPPASMSTLKAESAMLKAPFAIEYVKELLGQGFGPIVLFTDHRAPCEAITEAIDGSEYIRGDTPMPVRDTLVRKFQRKEIPLLVGTIGAMGTGLTLTESNTLIFLDRSYVPASNIQAYHRIYRASQKRRCRIIDIVRPGIDERISKILRKKESLIAQVNV